MTRAERAIKAMRECADALEDLPTPLRVSNILGIALNNPDTLRREADIIEERMIAFSVGNEVALPEDLPQCDATMLDKMCQRIMVCAKVKGHEIPDSEGKADPHHGWVHTS